MLKKLMQSCLYINMVIVLLFGSQIIISSRGLAGDVRLADVDFAYEEGKPVLRDVTVYAPPRQKVAFVGATGAGKTTITSLINRFYDIADGKIRYDGININKIKKADLRRSLGIVLQHGQADGGPHRVCYRPQALHCPERGCDHDPSARADHRAGQP